MGGITKYWKDDVYITVFVNNCGNKTRTFYVGCNIISPSGYVTESKDFYYGGQTYLSVSIPAGGTGNVTFREKLGWGLSSESQIIGRHNIVTCVYSDPGLSKDQKCRQGYDYIQIVARPTPNVGYYKFFSEPVTAVVYYQGSKIGITNAQDVYEFPTGSHTIEFKATGYITTATSISVEKGVTKTYTAHLSPVTAPPPTCLWKLRSGYPQYAYNSDWMAYGYKWSFVYYDGSKSALKWTRTSSKSELPAEYQCGV